MNKRTRAVALVMVVVMVLALLASMVLPYMTA
jgi:predicted nucleic acid-binding Zn ribbon protein